MEPYSDFLKAPNAAWCDENAYKFLVATKKIERPPDMMFITMVHMRKITKALTEFEKIDKKDLHRHEVIFAFLDLICAKVSRCFLVLPMLFYYWLLSIII